MNTRSGEKSLRDFVSIVLSCSILVAAIVFSSAGVLANSSSKSFSPYVDMNGNISLPKDFRLNMIHLGSWFVPSGGASGFHDVFTEPESAIYFRKHGKFPDGATLVKELRSADKGDFTTGAGVSYSTKKIKQWFVMIKDTQGRFKGNGTWGDGWGWALVKADSPEKNVTVNYRTECIACHIPAKKNDWVYLEGYPILNKQ